MRRFMIGNTKYYSGDKMKKLMALACDTCGGEERYIEGCDGET